MSRSKTSKRALLAEEKRQRAINLRLQGYTYQEIADEIGTTLSNSYKLVTSALTRIRQETNDVSENVKILELERVDSLFKYAYRAVINGDITAIDRAVKVMDRRSRLIGLDTSQKPSSIDNIAITPEWIRLRSVLISTLGNYPEAREAVLAAIESERFCEGRITN